MRRIQRAPAWRWWVCGLLLLATAINYMDRLTLNLLAGTINEDLGLNKLDYARIEVGFALAFALGAIAFGFLVDRFNVCWVYPLAVLAWSAAGFATGFAHGFLTLLACRFLLGLAESANWPCALRTTQRLLPPEDRAMGNGILQSGAAVGAILIPLVMLLLFDPQVPATWRVPFWVVGAAGVLWVVAWWASVRPADLRLADLLSPFGSAPAPGPAPARLACRFAALIVVVVTINMTWHFLRAWLPLYLRGLGYDQRSINLFASAYYVCTDAGVLTAGFVTLRLARAGRLSVHASRRLVFLGCALLAALCLAAPFLPPGPLLLGTLLAVGFGALGVFPNYYSWQQDLTVRHQGKVTGTLGCCCWLAMAAWQEVIGRVVEGTGSYVPCFVISGLAPLVGFAAVGFLWGPTERVEDTRPAHQPEAPALDGALVGVKTESGQRACFEHRAITTEKPP
jgi:ACS family hexuronate transporter-like MFS transporter